MFLSISLKKHFNSYNVTFFCCAIAFINKCLIAWVYNYISPDKALYFLFSKTLLQGNPPLEDTGLIDGSVNFFYNGAITSPLYSLLAIPFYSVTKSFFYTSFLLDVLSWLIFFTALYRLGKALFGELWIVNVFIIVCGFFLYPQEYISTPKDTLALGLMCWACFITTEIIKKQFDLLHTLFLYLILIALALIKYFFVPFLFLYPFLLFLFSIANKKMHLRKQGFLLIALAGISCIFFYGYLHYLRGTYHQMNIVPIKEENAIFGFHPEYLLSFFPFISSSVINTLFWTSQASKILNQPFSEIGVIWRIFDSILLLSFVALVVKKKLWKPLFKNIPWLVCIITASLIVFLLCLLTITLHSNEDLSKALWTFISSARFYLFIMLVIQLACFYFIFKSAAFPFLKLFIVFLFLIETSHGIYFTIKQLSGIKDVRRELLANNPISNIVYSVLIPYKKQNNGLFFTTPFHHVRRLAQINNIDVLFFTQDHFSVAEKNMTDLAVALPIKDAALFRNYSDLKLTRSDTVSQFIINFYKMDRH